MSQRPEWRKERGNNLGAKESLGSSDLVACLKRTVQLVTKWLVLKWIEVALLPAGGSDQVPGAVGELILDVESEDNTMGRSDAGGSRGVVLCFCLGGGRAVSFRSNGGDVMRMR